MRDSDSLLVSLLALLYLQDTTTYVDPARVAGQLTVTQCGDIYSDFSINIDKRQTSEISLFYTKNINDTDLTISAASHHHGSPN